MEQMEMKKRALKNLDYYITGLKNARTKFYISSNYFSACAVLHVIYFDLNIITTDEYDKLDKEITQAHTKAWGRM